MEEFTILVQIALSISVFYVWIFRFHNVIIDFKNFELSDVTRSFVGASKIALSTLIFAGIWFPPLVFVPSILLGLFMVSAQYFHAKISNPFIKRLPSLILLALCVFLALRATL
ncbi:MAG: DoxX family protein [Crocinitomicaceae bacterium]|nr:DoxX family protein [Crocinitomicaceae bacterium]MDG1347653.1 DoxX family protein [Crocinitomicaceae bacterium]MDG2463448.1 DoxX family protein [Crocinitomicaceae bacterium]